MPMTTLRGKWHRPASRWRKMRPAVRGMRAEPTSAEAVLWERLRGKQMAGFRFRRQHPIGPFIADFCYPELHLVIELDGQYHDFQQEQDAARQAFIEARGYSVLRFKNDEVLKHIDSVLLRIRGRLPEK